MLNAGGESNDAAAASRTSNALFRALYLRREYAIISRAEAIKNRCTVNTLLTSSECERKFPGIIGDTPPSEVLLLPPFGASGKTISRLYLECEKEECCDGLEGTVEHRRGPTFSAAYTSSCTPRSIQRFLFTKGSLPQVTVSNPGWHGLVNVTDTRSPWYGGCFAFTVFFPDRYPFDPPIIEMVGRWLSHPFLSSRPYMYHQQDNHTKTPVDPSVTESDADDDDETKKNIGPLFIPFDTIHTKIDSMRFSVMSQVLQHVYDVFSPEQWSSSFLRKMSNGKYTDADDVLANINHSLAHRDVEHCSLTQEVVLGKPYVDYLNTAVFHQFITQLNNCCAANTTQLAERDSQDYEGTHDAQQNDKWITWYGRDFLPMSLKLP